MKLKSLAICMLMIINYVYGQPESHGFIDIYTSMHVSDEPYNIQSSISRYRGGLSGGNEKIRFKVTGDLSYNYVLEKPFTIGLWEMYLEYYSNLISFKAGRQFISWGNCDAINVTNILNPEDYTRTFAYDLMENQLPIEAVKIELMKQKVNLELIWIPFFHSPKIPEKDDPWYTESMEIPNYYPLKVNNSQKNDFSLKNSEIGIRNRYFLSGIDFAFQFYSGLKDVPIPQSQFKSDTLDISFVRNRHHLIGIEASKPMERFVFRAEGGVFIDNQYAIKEIGSVKNKNEIKGAIGIDWFGPANTNAGFQYIQNYICEYENIISDDRKTFLMTANLSKKIYRELIEFSDWVVFNDENGFNRFEITTLLGDDLALHLGYDYFWGEKSDLLGQYKKNSSLWFAAKYSY